MQRASAAFRDFPGRRWEGLHRHLALSMLAYSFLMLHSSVTRGAGGSSSEVCFPLGEAHDASSDPQAGTDVAAGKLRCYGSLKPRGSRPSDLVELTK